MTRATAAVTSIVITLATASFLGGCATSTPSAGEVPGRRTTVLAIPEVRSVYKDPDPLLESVVQVPLDEVIFYVKRTMIDLEIPLTIDDAKTGAYGNNDFTKIYRISNTPMMQFLDCGSSANGPRSTTHRMYMSLVTYVEKINDRSTKLRIALTANAADPANSNSRVPCGSTGKLEQRILESVRGKPDEV
ncbi:MAG: hypothetical protein ACO1Q7_03135 [Gemmatimonas sp.]